LSRADRLKRLGRTAATYVAITLGTLVLFDVVLIASGLFPPETDPGDPEVGWLAARPTGEVRTDSCFNLTTGEAVTYVRNEDGFRTSWAAAELRARDDLLKIAVGGDSHTDLCERNADIHFGVMERELNRAGLESAAFSLAAGKYSPLQAYLAVRPALREYPSDAFTLNFYTGNDFLDMLRIDDRPHLVAREEGEYDIAPPIWYQLDPPGRQPRSRVLFTLRSLADRIGLRQTWVRVHYLRDTASEQGEGLFAVIRYMNHLRRGMAPELSYPAAFVAQILNQQIFFETFPGSRDESIERVRALLRMIRAENPGVILVMSPIPSYQLVGGEPVDPAFLRVLERVPVSYDGGRREEAELYEALRVISADEGWLFVDNLTALQAYEGDRRLYNEADYHIEPVASEIIGALQADVVRGHLEGQAQSEPDPPGA
jgi:hypothetical protein